MTKRLTRAQKEVEAAKLRAETVAVEEGRHPVVKAPPKRPGPLPRHVSSEAYFHHRATRNPISQTKDEDQ